MDSSESSHLASLCFIWNQQKHGRIGVEPIFKQLVTIKLSMSSHSMPWRFPAVLASRFGIIRRLFSVFIVGCGRILRTRMMIAIVLAHNVTVRLGNACLFCDPQHFAFVPLVGTKLPRRGHPFHRLASVLLEMRLW